METTRQSPAQREAAQRSLAVHAAGRTLKRAIDRVVVDLAGKAGTLAADCHKLGELVGSDSTRPHYTDDLRVLNRQRERVQLLLDLVKRPEL